MQSAGGLWQDHVDAFAIDFASMTCASRSVRGQSWLDLETRTFLARGQTMLRWRHLSGAPEELTSHVWAFSGAWRPGTDCHRAIEPLA